MREIKFRAWDKSQDRYLLGYTPDDQPKREFIFVEFCIGFSSYDYTDLIIEQYIGLNDKNGVEIYEGDIIKICGSFLGDYGVLLATDPIFEVKWLAPSFLLEEQGNGYGLVEIDRFLKHALVIGNIHEGII